MNVRIASLAVVFVMLLGGAALAGGTWSDKINYRHSNQTSMKVLEPDGFKVVLTLADGSEKAGTVPELFTLPDTDAFVKVTITPTDGSAPWSKKIEVRARQQTELAVTFKPDAPKADAPAAKAGRSYVGRLSNKGAGCGRAWGRTIKMELLRNPDGTNVKTVQIDSNKNSDVELPAGAYDVRVFVWNDKEWKFVVTNTHEIGKDGWKLGFGCLTGKSDPIVIAE